MIPASKTLSVALGAGGVGTTPNSTDYTTRDPTALGVYGGITSLTIEDYGIFQAPCINTVPPPANFTQNVVLYPGTITPLNIDGPFGGAQAFDYDPSKFGGGGVRITTDAAQMPGKSGYYSLTLTPITLLNPTIQATSATSVTITSVTVVPGITYTYIIIPSASSGSSGTITSSNTLITGIDPTVSYSILVTGTLGERIVAQSGELKIAATNPQPIDPPKLATPSTPVLTSIAGSPVSLLITNIETSPKTERSFFYALSTAPKTWIPLPNGSTQYTLTGLPYAASYSVKIQVKEVYQIFTNYAESASSNIVTPIEIPKPTTPVLSQIAKSYTSLLLTNIDKNPLLSYSYSTDNGATWKSIPKNAVSFTITGLLPGTTYTASVRAKTGGLFSAAAVSNSATTPGIPRANKPTLSTISKSYTSLQITNIDNAAGISYSYALNTAPTAWIPLPKGVISYTVTGLLLGTTYYVNIRGNVGTLIGLPSMNSNTAIISPSTPVLGMASSSYTSLQITNIDNIGGYTYSYALNSAPNTWIPFPQGTTTSYTITGLVGSQQYSVGIQAKDTTGKTYTSTFSNVVTAGLVSTPTLTQTSYTSATIGNIDTVSGYTYSYALNTAPNTWIPFPQGTTTSYTLTGLVVGQQYSVGIQARDTSGNLTYSQFSIVAILGVTTPILSIAPTSNSQLKITNIDTVPGYTYSYALSTAPTTWIPFPQGTTTSYTLTGLVVGQQYSVGIQARDQSGKTYTSTFSNTGTIPYPAGTILFTWPSGNYIPAGGYTLLQPMYLMCTLAGGQGSRWTNQYAQGRLNGYTTYLTDPGGPGAICSIDSMNVKLSKGMRVDATNPLGRPMVWYKNQGDKGGDCALNIYNNNTIVETIVAGGGKIGYEEYPRWGNVTIPVDNLNISQHILTWLSYNGNMVGGEKISDYILSELSGPFHGYYTIRLIPEKGLDLKTPTLSVIPGSWTSLIVGNMDIMVGYTYYYSLDNGMTYTLLSDSTITGLLSDTLYSVCLHVRDASGNIAGSTYASNTVKTPSLPIPTLSQIAGSYTSLLVGNVDSTPGFTYYYRLNTQPVDTHTAISSLEKSGNGYILPNLVPEQDYSIGIVAKRGDIYGIESAFSFIVRTGIPKPSRPTLERIADSYTTLLLGNVDSLPGFTYFYRLNTQPAGTYTAIIPSPSGNGYIITGLVPEQDYTVGIIASFGGVYGAESVYSSPVRTQSLPTPSTPTLQTIPGSYTTLLLGNVDSIPGLTYFYRLNTQPAGTRTAITNLQKSGNGYIIPGLVPEQDYTVGITASNAGLYGAESVFSSLARTTSIPKPSTPTLQTIPGSFTTLLLGNVDSIPGLTYFYRLNTQSAGTRTPITNLQKSGNGYIIPGLVPEQDYAVGIIASGDNVYSQESVSSSVVRTVQPSTPTLQTIPGSYTTLLLGNIDSLPGYTYFYRLNTQPAGTRTPITNLQKSGNGYILPGLVFEQDYTIGITASYAGVYSPESMFSSPIVRTTPIPKPSTPTLGLIAGSTTSLLLGNVPDNTSDLTYYYRLITQPFGARTAITNLQKSGNGYIVSGLVPNQFYSIGIIASNGGLYGEESIYSNIIKPGIAPKPSTPTLSLIAGSSTSLLVGNVDSLSGLTYYYRLNTFPFGQYKPITDLAPSGSGYIVSGLVRNQQYSIGIIASFGGVYGPESVYSTIVTIP
jgi:hypothetical protein